MIISWQEALDVIVLTLALGFIFMDLVPAPARKKLYGALNLPYDIEGSGFDWKRLWHAAILVGPAIIIHEAAHKAAALAFGMQAVFHANYLWLGIGILLKLINFGFIFIVPAFVSISGTAQYLQQAIISFAGPAVHLILFLIAFFITKNKKIPKDHYAAWMFIKRINLILFIFNMLPIPMFDGWGVYSNLWKAIF
jgi:Zn-dependent protease